ncbi:hypothetical protein P8864_04960, partial [Priestia flexa]
GQVMGDFYGKRRFICEMFTCFTIKNEKSLRLTRTLQVSRQSEKVGDSSPTFYYSHIVMPARTVVIIIVPSIK